MEIADLVRKRAYVYEVANLSFLGLGMYHKLIYNKSFEYRWLNLAECHIPRLLAVRAALHHRGNSTVVLQLAGFTYERINCTERTCTLTYRPLSVESNRMKYYTNLAKRLCEVIEGLTGINCIVNTVEPSKHCFVPPSLLIERRGDNLVYSDVGSLFCEKIKGIDILKIIESPKLLAFDNISGTPGIRYRGTWLVIYAPRNLTPPPLIVLQLMSYILGMPQLNPSGNEPRWCTQIFNYSTSVNGTALTLGQAIVIAIALYNDYTDSPEIQEIIAKNLLSLGINPRNLSILLTSNRGQRDTSPILLYHRRRHIKVRVLHEARSPRCDV